MSYEIRTIEFHKAQLKCIAEANQRRLEEQIDPMDCALSSWAGDSMQRFHCYAIELLEQGLEQFGEEIPCTKILTLVDSGDNVVSEKTSRAVFNYQETFSWRLSEEMTKKYGRGFIPKGSRSRIQKQLGLTEKRIMKRVKPYLAAKCAFVGAGVSFHTIPLDA